MQYVLKCYHNGTLYALDAKVTSQRAELLYKGDTVFNNDYNFFMKLIKDYNTDDLVNGPPFMDRKLFSILKPIAFEMPAQILLRCFGVISNYLFLKFFEYSVKEEDSYENINKQCNIVLFDFSMVEWTGGMGTQPTMYFLKKEKIEKNEESAEALFKIGLLHQINVYTNQDIVSYYMPLVLPSVRRVKIAPNLRFWNDILNDRNEEIRNFVEGKRTPK